MVAIAVFTMAAVRKVRDGGGTSGTRSAASSAGRGRGPRDLDHVTLNGAKKLTRTDATFSSGSVGLSLGYRAATNTIAVPLWIDDFTASVH